MVRFTAEGKDGRQLIGLCVSRENINRLTAGKPIRVPSESLNLPWKGDIIIYFGETEEAIKESLKEFIGPQTLMHEEPPPNKASDADPR